MSGWKGGMEPGKLKLNLMTLGLDPLEMSRIPNRASEGKRSQ